MFAGLLSASCWYCATHRRPARDNSGLLPFRVLTSRNLLFDRSAHVLSAVAMRARNHLGLAGLHQRGRGIAMYAFWVIASAAGFLTHYFFVFPWLAVVVCLAISPGKLKRWHLVACTLAVAALILPSYSNLPASLGAWRVTKDWLNWRPWHFNRMAAMFQLVAQFFDGHGKYLWPSHRMSSVAALMLFGIIAVVMVWRLRLHLFHSRLALLWLPFAAACAGPLVFDLLRHTYTVAVPRYAIAALPDACLLAALGLACLKFRTRIFMLLLIALAWAPNAVKHLSTSFADFRTFPRSRTSSK